MAKGRKTAALAALGLGAAALSGLFDKKKDKTDTKTDTKTETKSADTTADASAGMAKDRLGGIGLDRGAKDTTGDMSAGMAKDSLSSMKTPIRKAPVRRAPVRKAPGYTAQNYGEDPFTGEQLSDIAKERAQRESGPFRKGGKVKKYASGGSVSSASKRADGCAVKGKTRGRMV